MNTFEGNLVAENIKIGIVVARFNEFITSKLLAGALIDYFRVRFPTTDALKIIREVLQLKADYMLYEDFGKYGYESKYVLGDINIMCSMQEHLGVLLELKGRGCRQMESYLLAQERSWYDFMLDCLTAGGKMKRLDLAINDKAGILDIPKLKEKYKAGECISYFRMQKDYSGTEKCGSDLPKNTGETLYLGSTSSELYMCAYQKNYEQWEIWEQTLPEIESANQRYIEIKEQLSQNSKKAVEQKRSVRQWALQLIQLQNNSGQLNLDENDDWDKYLEKMDEVLNQMVQAVNKDSIIYQNSRNWVNSTYTHLDADAKEFLITAETLYEIHKMSIIDFAPIIVEYCKVVEKQLMVMMEIAYRPWRGSINTTTL